MILSGQRGMFVETLPLELWFESMGAQSLAYSLLMETQYSTFLRNIGHVKSVAIINFAVCGSITMLFYKHPWRGIDMSDNVEFMPLGLIAGIFAGIAFIIVNKVGAQTRVGGGKSID